MRALDARQARMTLGLISLSVAVQLLGLPVSFMVVSGMLLLAGWLHWLWYWPVPKGLRFLGLMAFGVMIFAQFGNFFGLEPMVALFVGSLLLKLLEVRTQRDVYLLVALSLFGLATPLLFNPELWWFLAILALAVLHVSLLAILHGQRSGRRALRGAAAILWRALPLAALLFFIVPRLPPMWAVPMASHQSLTGLSDSLRLGAMDSLSRDASLAFSARFDDPDNVPSPGQRYWRSLMLVDYDGDHWMAADVSHLRGKKPSASQTSDWDFSLLMSPSGQRWVPVLGSAMEWPNAMEYLADGTVRARHPIHARQLIPLSADQSIVNVPLSTPWWNRLTALPPGLHPQTRAYARTLGNQYPGDEVLTEILKQFNEENFSYTLQPSPLVGDKVDSFMFDTKQGYCEHYAVAFAVMARELGYPTRIATGYLGGEESRVDPSTLMVYQYDAHAWVEVWLSDQGWVRFDPTAWINPSRIESPPELRPEWQGANLPVLEELAWLLRGQLWLSQLRHATEWMNLNWMQFMAGFDGSGQAAFLKRWLGKVDVSTMLMLLGVFIAPGWLWYSRGWWWPKKTDVAKKYRQLLAQFRLPVHLTPQQLAQQLSVRFPQQSELIEHECSVLQSYWYTQVAVEMKHVESALRKLKDLKQ